MTEEHRAQIAGFLSGTGVAVAVSSGLAVERLTRGSTNAALLANFLSTVAAVVVFVIATRSNYLVSTPFVALPQIAGVLFGTLAVHGWLIAGPQLTHAWLTEAPRQLVNDFVASFSILGMAWACARRSALTGIIAVAALLAGYHATMSLWHLDAAFFRAVSVQQLVLAETLAAVVAILIFRAISSSASTMP
ncbi:MAG: hypothetical protein ABI461_22905 [Polyangiaceae bacterium]